MLARRGEEGYALLWALAMMMLFSGAIVTLLHTRSTDAQLASKRFTQKTGHEDLEQKIVAFKSEWVDAVAQKSDTSIMRPSDIVTLMQSRLAANETTRNCYFYTVDSSLAAQSARIQASDFGVSSDFENFSWITGTRDPFVGMAADVANIAFFLLNELDRSTPAFSSDRVIHDELAAITDEASNNASPHETSADWGDWGTLDEKGTYVGRAANVVQQAMISIRRIPVSQFGICDLNSTSSLTMTNRVIAGSVRRVHSNRSIVVDSTGAVDINEKLTTAGSLSFANGSETIRMNRDQRIGAGSSESDWRARSETDYALAVRTDKDLDLKLQPPATFNQMLELPTDTGDIAEKDSEYEHAVRLGYQAHVVVSLGTSGGTVSATIIRNRTSTANATLKAIIEAALTEKTIDLSPGSLKAFCLNYAVVSALTPSAYFYILPTDTYLVVTNSATLKSDGLRSLVSNRALYISGDFNLGGEPASLIAPAVVALRHGI